MRYRNRRTALVVVAVLVILAAALAALKTTGRSHTNSVALKQLQFESQGIDNPGAESNEYLTAAQQFAEARTSPSGIVNPGAYGTAVSDLKAMPTLPGTWTDVTAVKYDADHPAYRDYFSNSSGGSGLVTGRITGLAAYRPLERLDYRLASHELRVMKPNEQAYRRTEAPACSGWLLPSRPSPVSAC